MGEVAQKSVAIVVLLAFMASYCLGADTSAVLLRTSGPVMVNGTLVSDAAALRANDVVETLQTTHASVTGNGNAVTLAPRSNFVVLDNSFVLGSGGTQIVTTTGISALVKAYTVSPKDSKVKTTFEVDWADHSVYVYARVGDVKIHGPCEDWTVEQGKVAKIENPLRCKPGVLILNDPAGTVVNAVAIGSIEAAVLAAIILTRSMSAEAP